MKFRIYPSNERGFANHGWLKSYHSFSFASFYKEDLMGFGMLRVLNDDVVEAGRGFGAHPHDNMEIVSIPLEGALHHSDSTGRKEVIKSGEVQLMSAGSGIVHSEMNASQTDRVHFLQVWVLPLERNINPRYQQKHLSVADRINNFQTVVAPNDNNALIINQNSWFTLSDPLQGNQSLYKLHRPENGLYVYVIDGQVQIAEQSLSAGDAIGVWNSDQAQIIAQQDSKLLLIEVPMN